MILVNAHKGGKFETLEKYLTDITLELDKLGNTQKRWYKHYILANGICKKNRSLPIRVPGLTIGEIRIDQNFAITNVSITDGCLKNYKRDVNKRLQKYIGEKIEFEK